MGGSGRDGLLSCRDDARGYGGRQKSGGPRGYGAIEFPSATWAIFDAWGELPGAVQEIYKRFYGEWLPNSKFELDNLPVIKCYMQDNRQEVWIAVKTSNEKK